MSREVKAAIVKAFARLPAGMFVLTAEHEDHRLGSLVSFVQKVSNNPPMVSVAVSKGDPIMPLISESRRFGLCQLAADDKVLRRKFGNDSAHGEDPFLGLELTSGLLPRVPVLSQSLSYMECEVIRHLDVEGDHDLFVGIVKAAGGREGQALMKSGSLPPPEGAQPWDQQPGNGEGNNHHGPAA